MDRKLQLNVINEYLGTKFKLNEDDKIMFFEEIFKKLQVKINKEQFPNSVFFFNEDIVYMELDVNSKERFLYCSYRYIWSIFEREFSMEYKDVQSFIKSRMEEYFKSELVTPVVHFSDHR